MMACFRVSYMTTCGGGNVVGAKDLAECAVILETLFNEEMEARARNTQGFVVGRVWKEGIKFNWFCETEEG